MARALFIADLQPCRMLKKSAAAAYCGLSVTDFERNCKAVSVIYPNGKKMWDVRDLDAWLDALKAGQDVTDDEILNRLGN
jgi:hypothetical protein